MILEPMYLILGLRKDEVAYSEKIEVGIIIDNKKGETVGIEVPEFSKKKVDLADLIVKGLPILI